MRLAEGENSKMSDGEQSLESLFSVPSYVTETGVFIIH